MENKQNILVIGGTGKTGRKIVNKLNTLGHNVRVGSRSATPAFGWDNPDTWEDAMQNIDKVYITFQPDLAVPGALEAIETLVKKAKNCKVKKLVLLSGKGEREAELCEQVVIHSGLDYTIVRASWFNQNFSESFLIDPILEGFVALPQAEAKIPFVDTGDIADVAVEALLHDKHNGKMYQLTAALSIVSAYKWQPNTNTYTAVNPEQNAFGTTTQTQPILCKIPQTNLNLQLQIPNNTNIPGTTAITVWLGITYLKEQNNTHTPYKTPKAMQCIAII